MKDIKIAVTGGIGSGKSAVLEIIKDLGYNVVSCDEVYAQLLQEDDFVKGVSFEMGVKPIRVENKLFLDRKAISNIVFNDKRMLKRLNDFTHSEILKRAFSLYDSGIVFYEVPLLFEGGYESKFDKVFVVVRDYEARVLSAMKRDNATRAEVERKIKNQVNYDKIDLSLHTIIENNHGIDELRLVIVNAIEEIKKESL